MYEVELKRRPVGGLSSVLPRPQAARLEEAMQRAADALAGRRIWNVSSTANGGGVAEMLYGLLGYFLDAGIEARWLVIDGDEQFFAITKRVHNAIHGITENFTDADHAYYEQVLARNLPSFLNVIKPGDIVMLHDPQTAGLAIAASRENTRVAWRSHIGRDHPDSASIAGWEFVRRYLENAAALVFSRAQYAPSWAGRGQVRTIPPSIDPLSPKNRPIAPAECVRILDEAGLPTGGRLVTQVSRWDRLKDMPGVMAGFGAAAPPPDVRLVLAGPAVTGVTDDPEGVKVFNECQLARAQLPSGIRERVHLASIPMDDAERNATIVNALQRHATIIVQKSLVEGFGLTVAEGMWKTKPVIGSAVGGIQDQIISQRSGLLLPDPAAPAGLSAALRRLLDDEALAARLGLAAHERVLEHYLDDRQLIQLVALLEDLTAGAPTGRSRPPVAPAQAGPAPGRAPG